MINRRGNEERLLIVHIYVVMGLGDRPSKIGVIVPEAALENLPKATMEVNLPLPPRAIAKPPLTEIRLNWNPQGHLPEGVYTVPHLDFHFFTLPHAERQQITTTGPSDHCGTIAVAAVPGYGQIALYGISDGTFEFNVDHCDHRSSASGSPEAGEHFCLLPPQSARLPSRLGGEGVLAASR
ncbi:DUF5602 domain-containing protein [Halomicronema sp. CCY15110]|uniref:DUF5602 domain-containing protein n=1 Tax=Halomicronema sp. CCY15110 TaxID=2767773 RepID=UPI00194E89A9|nr:DUF5602 domain-containing protein [Halomicronema sp. CCY15110]